MQCGASRFGGSGCVSHVESTSHPVGRRVAYRPSARTESLDRPLSTFRLGEPGGYRATREGDYLTTHPYSSEAVWVNAQSPSRRRKWSRWIAAALLVASTPAIAQDPPAIGPVCSEAWGVGDVRVACLGNSNTQSDWQFARPDGFPREEGWCERLADDTNRVTTLNCGWGGATASPNASGFPYFQGAGQLEAALADPMVEIVILAFGTNDLGFSLQNPDHLALDDPTPTAIADVIEMLADAGELAHPVAVRVGEGPRIDLVDDRGLPPRRTGAFFFHAAHLCFRKLPCYSRPQCARLDRAADPPPRRPPMEYSLAEVHDVRALDICKERSFPGSFSVSLAESNLRSSFCGTNTTVSQRRIIIRRCHLGVWTRMSRSSSCARTCSSRRAVTCFDTEACP